MSLPLTFACLPCCPCPQPAGPDAQAKTQGAHPPVHPSWVGHSTWRHPWAHSGVCGGPSRQCGALRGSGVLSRRALQAAAQVAAQTGVGGPVEVSPHHGRSPALGFRRRGRGAAAGQSAGDAGEAGARGKAGARTPRASCSGCPHQRGQGGRRHRLGRARGRGGPGYCSSLSLSVPPVAPHKPDPGCRGLGCSLNGRPPDHSAGREEVGGEQTTQGRPPGPRGHQAGGRSASSRPVTGWSFLSFLPPIPLWSEWPRAPRAPRDPRRSCGARGRSVCREGDPGLSLVRAAAGRPRALAPFVRRVESALSSRCEGLGGGPRSRPSLQPSAPSSPPP